MPPWRRNRVFKEIAALASSTLRPIERSLEVAPLTAPTTQDAVNGVETSNNRVMKLRMSFDLRETNQW